MLEMSKAKYIFSNLQLKMATQGRITKVHHNALNVWLFGEVLPLGIYSNSFAK
jgi:hypothetical protein